MGGGIDFSLSEFRDNNYRCTLTNIDTGKYYVLSIFGQATSVSSISGGEIIDSIFGAEEGWSQYQIKNIVIIFKATNSTTVINFSGGTYPVSVNCILTKIN